MGGTFKDKDFRKIRKAGNSVRCLFGSKPIRRRLGKSIEANAEAKRIIYTYTEKELYDMAHRRHSAAHRKSAMKTKNRCKRSEKRSERNNSKKELQGE